MQNRRGQYKGIHTLKTLDSLTMIRAFEIASFPTWKIRKDDSAIKQKAVERGVRAVECEEELNIEILKIDFKYYYDALPKLVRVAKTPLKEIYTNEKPGRTGVIIYREVAMVAIG